MLPSQNSRFFKEAQKKLLEKDNSSELSNSEQLGSETELLCSKHRYTPLEKEVVELLLAGI